MHPRRAWLQRVAAMASTSALATTSLGVAQAAPRNAQTPDTDMDTPHPSRRLQFPRDHGAHVGCSIEWWYATGWLGHGSTGPHYGFQCTFFRRRTGLATASQSRLAPRHLLMAHAAITDLRAGKHVHDQRLGRWSGGELGRDDRAGASLLDASVQLDGWRLSRLAETAAGAASRATALDAAPAVWHAEMEGTAFKLALRMTRTQPLLLQGAAGYSRKGPLPAQASHYYTEPQLKVDAMLGLSGAPTALEGRAWLDHEWSSTLMPEDAMGWDWVGINLDDGSALTAFQLRRADGSAVWAGGSFRAKGQAEPRVFGATELRMAGQSRRWRSPATQADYPMAWSIDCPVGRFDVRSLLDAQEIDARSSTGTVYWEGLASLHDASGQRVGLGYLEMTGYAGRLRV
jgi:predicted secreted hydrolase